MITSFSFTQVIKDKEVPLSVKNSFPQKYPDVKKIKWEKEEEGYYAEFEHLEKDYSVLIDYSGSILETEVEIEAHELPSLIRNT